jgi:hypothetical protein
VRVVVIAGARTAARVELAGVAGLVRASDSKCRGGCGDGRGLAAIRAVPSLNFLMADPFVSPDMRRAGRAEAVGSPLAGGPVASPVSTSSPVGESLSTRRGSRLDTFYPALASKAANKPPSRQTHGGTEAPRAATRVRACASRTSGTRSLPNAALIAASPMPTALTRTGVRASSIAARTPSTRAPPASSHSREWLWSRRLSGRPQRAPGELVEVLGQLDLSAQRPEGLRHGTARRRSTATRWATGCPER